MACLTCVLVVGAFEVLDEQVARDDDGGVAQHVEQEAEGPHIVPAVQHRPLALRRRRRPRDEERQCWPQPGGKTRGTKQEQKMNHC